MTRIGISLRRVLDRARRLTPRLAAAGRWTLACAILASLLASAVGPTAPAYADPPPEPPGPVARLQVIVHSILVRHDRDYWGSGEMQWWASICPADGTPGRNCDAGNGVIDKYGFSASSGDTVSPERVVPRDGDRLTGETTVEAGLPVYSGQHYVFQLGILEFDPIGGDDMGSVVADMDEEHGWGIGTYTAYGQHSDEGLNDYQVTYEIRRTPLPDLQVHGFNIMGTVNDRFYCGQVENIGQRPSGPSSVTVRVDTQVLRTVTIQALDIGQTTSHCVRRQEMPPREVVLWFTLDEGQQVPEMDEANNVHGLGISAIHPTVPSAAPPAQATTASSGAIVSPEPNPSAGQPDPGQGQPNSGGSRHRGR